MSKYRLTITMDVENQSFSYAVATDDPLEITDAYQAFSNFGGKPENLAAGMRTLAEEMEGIKRKRLDEAFKERQKRQKGGIVVAPPGGLGTI